MRLKPKKDGRSIESQSLLDQLSTARSPCSLAGTQSSCQFRSGSPLQGLVELGSAFDRWQREAPGTEEVQSDAGDHFQLELRHGALGGQSPGHAQPLPANECFLGVQLDMPPVHSTSSSSSSCPRKSLMHSLQRQTTSAALDEALRALEAPSFSSSSLAKHGRFLHQRQSSQIQEQRIQQQPQQQQQQQQQQHSLRSFYPNDVASSETVDRGHFTLSQGQRGRGNTISSPIVDVRGVPPRSPGHQLSGLMRSVHWAESSHNSSNNNNRSDDGWDREVELLGSSVSVASAAEEWDGSRAVVQSQHQPRLRSRLEPTASTLRPPTVLAIPACYSFGLSLEAQDEDEDQQLLLQLGRLAEGAPDDDEEDFDGDILSHGVLDCLPEEVQLDEPPVRRLLSQCANLWDALEQDRALLANPPGTSELAELREVTAQRQREAIALEERVKFGEELWRKRLEQERIAAQELSVRLSSERRAARESKAASTLASLIEKERQLKAAIEQEDNVQAELMFELNAAADMQSRLQSELEVERTAATQDRYRILDIQKKLQEKKVQAEDEEQMLLDELAQARRRRMAWEEPGWLNLDDELFLAGPNFGLEGLPEEHRSIRLWQRQSLQRGRLRDLQRQIKDEEAQCRSLRHQLRDAGNHLASGPLVSGAILAEVLGLRDFDPSATAQQEEEAATWWEEQLELAQNEALAQQTFSTTAAQDPISAADETQNIATQLVVQRERTALVADEEKRLRAELQEAVESLASLEERVSEEEQLAQGAGGEGMEELVESVAMLQREVATNKVMLKREEQAASGDRQTWSLQIQEQKRLLERQRSACQDLESQLLQQRRKRGRSQTGSRRTPVKQPATIRASSSTGGSSIPDSTPYAQSVGGDSGRYGSSPALRHASDLRTDRSGGRGVALGSA